MNKVKTLLSFIFVLLILGAVNVSAKEKDIISDRTYIIGTHEFTPDIAMTTDRIMLAAKTITGEKLEDMIIYYKNIDSIWVNGITGNPIPEESLPEEFDIEYINNIEVMTGEFIYTNKIGVPPETAGDAAGSIRAEFQAVDKEGKSINLSNDGIDSIYQVYNGERKDLTINTDLTLWFDLTNKTGTYTYHIKTKSGKIYKIDLKFDFDDFITKNSKSAELSVTGKTGIVPEGYGEASGKLTVEYVAKSGDQAIDLSNGQSGIKSIYSIYEGVSKKLQVTTDKNIWFNTANPSGKYQYIFVTNNNELYKIDFDYTLKSGKLSATGNAGIVPEGNGDASGKFTFEYIAKEINEDDNIGNQIDLSNGENGIHAIYSVYNRVNKKLQVNTDKTIWFNTANPEGIYKYIILTKSGEVFEIDFDYSIKSGTLSATGKAGIVPEGYGDASGKYTVEYMAEDSEGNQIDLSNGEKGIKAIYSVYKGKSKKLQVTTDKNIWFSTTNPNGEYKYVILTKSGDLFNVDFKFESETINSEFNGVVKNIDKIGIFYSTADKQFIVLSDVTEFGFTVGEDNWTASKLENEWVVEEIEDVIIEDGIET